MWKNKKKLKITTSLRAYLFISVKNQCYNYLGRSPEKNESLSIDKNDFLNPSPNPHESYVFNELEKDINDAIDCLSPQCKSVFLLSRSEGLKYNEISTKLNITEKAVEANISRALKSLKGKLKRFMPFKE
jgi:RNA polymerase sigma-70 factor (ECF subfamily)